MKNRFEIISNEVFIDAYKIAKSRSDLARSLNLPINGITFQYIDSMIKNHKLEPIKKISNIKYQKIDIKCPICTNIFETQLGHPKAKKTCSYACSNTYFRSDINNGSFKNGKHAYRNKAFFNNEHKCSICGYNRLIEVLEVHHKDNNHNNNDLSNLTILCPTCHVEQHFLTKSGKFKVK